MDDDECIACGCAVDFFGPHREMFDDVAGHLQLCADCMDDFDEDGDPW